MDVVVSLDHRFSSLPDGSVWSRGTFSYPFWKRHLSVFAGVKVVARVRQLESIPTGWTRADGEGVVFHGIPDYVGPWGYLWKKGSLKSVAAEALGSSDAVIMRVGSHIANCLEPVLDRSNHPFALEVVNDPNGLFTQGSFRHPLRPFFRWWFTRRLKRQCKRAVAVAYVTSSYLQSIYIPSSDDAEFAVSDVDLPEDSILTKPREYLTEKREFTAIFVGSLEQLYKRLDVLIDAVALCLKQGSDLKLRVVGDGRYRAELARRAESVGVGKQIEFLGWLPSGEPVNEQLDSADLFILPSRQEGLPRAMVEAMARGLPCIGTAVGGIPELLPEDDLVEPGDAVSLSRKITEVLSSPERLNQMSIRNVEKAKKYSERLLRGKRESFYRYVKEKTEDRINV